MTMSIPEVILVFLGGVAVGACFFGTMFYAAGRDGAADRILDRNLGWKEERAGGRTVVVLGHDCREFVEKQSMVKQA